MQDKSFLDNLNKLFSKKKFNEVIIKIKENNQFLKNYPDLYNISAVCKILKSKGAKIIGGCCEITPKHIKTLKNLV